MNRYASRAKAATAIRLIIKYAERFALLEKQALFAFLLLVKEAHAVEEEDAEETHVEEEDAEETHAKEAHANWW